MPEDANITAARAVRDQARKVHEETAKLLTMAQTSLDFAKTDDFADEWKKRGKPDK